jgi:methylmalonyl-CoA mutase
VSISGYHIDGANPISQLAPRSPTASPPYQASRGGMPVDEFAPNLSFFFFHGMDPEYAVLAVSRSALGVAMRSR